MNWFVEKLNCEQAGTTDPSADPRDDADAGLADRIAQALRTERAAELVAASAPPRAPAPEPPAWLFGPRHRELDAQRRAAAEAARHEPPELDQPAAPPLPRLCPCCLQPLPPRSVG